MNALKGICIVLDAYGWFDRFSRYCTNHYWLMVKEE